MKKNYEINSSSTIKDYFNYILTTSAQIKIALLLMIAGITIGCICIFAIPPIGEISNSAMGLVSELLVLSGGLLGVNASFNYKLSKFESEIIDKFQKK